MSSRYSAHPILILDLRNASLVSLKTVSLLASLVAASCVDTSRSSGGAAETFDASFSNDTLEAGAPDSTADTSTGDAGSTPHNTPVTTTVTVTASDPITYSFQNVAIGGGGFVTGIHFHPTEPGLLYAFTDISGAFRWDEAANRWLPLLDWVGYDLPDLMGIESLALDPTDPERVYLAAGMYAQSFAPLASILRSTDRGESWDVLPAPFHVGGNEDGRGTGPRLVVDPQNPATLYFGSRLSGLLVSPDHGESWTPVPTFPSVDDTSNMGVGTLFFDESGTLYAGIERTHDNLYRSRDRGETWEPVPDAPAGLLPHRAAVASNVAVLTYKDGPGPYDVYQGAVAKLNLSDGTWTDITPFPGEFDFGYAGIAIDPNDPESIVVATLNRYDPHEEILRSTDGGRSWIALAHDATWDKAGSGFLGTDDPGYYDLHWMVDLALDPFQPESALVVTGAGIWRSDDIDALDATSTDAGTGTTDAGVATPPTWTFFNRGLENTVVDDLISPESGAAHLVTVMGDIGGFWHTDLATPAPARHQNPGSQSLQVLDYAGSAPDQFVRVGYDFWNADGLVAGFSEDSGHSWEPLGWIPQGILDRQGTVALAADGSRILWLAPGGLAYFSLDRGESWEGSSGLPAFNGLDATWVNTDPKVAADRVDPSSFYAFDVIGGALYVSRDGGENFEATVTDLPRHPDYLARRGTIHTVPGHAGELWLTTLNGLYRSKDRGASVTKYEGFVNAYGLGMGKAVDGREYPSLYVIGTLHGETALFRSDDTGNSWARITTDAQQFGGFELVTGDPRSAGRVYLGCFGRGILYGDPETAAVTE